MERTKTMASRTPPTVDTRSRDGFLLADGPRYRLEGHIVGAREGCHVCRSTWARALLRASR